MARALADVRTIRRRGRLVEAVGATLRVAGLDARIGQQCELVDPDSGVRIAAEVVGLSGGQALLMPLAPLNGVSLSAEVVVASQELTVPFGAPLLGRVLDARGVPIDGGLPLPASLPRRPVFADAPNPLQRRPINELFPTGVRAIDSLLTVGVGQRVGIFAGAGVGKSTLLGMLARQRRTQVNVVALIGERGREVREFIDDSLGPEARARTVLVVATSDRPSMERARAAHVATAIAEGFRAEGADVLLMMDSVTRFARALREIGLAAGEPAVRRGFPPSVFAELPRLFERAGNDARGSITGFYSVLLEDEDTADPVGEEVRSILDGHIVLSRKLAQQFRYPAIDVLGSVSRVFNRVTQPPHQMAAAVIRQLIARHAELEFMIQMGEYKAGTDPVSDAAVQRQPQITALLNQRSEESVSMGETMMAMAKVVG
ncbi:MAG: FliI/YscN family ATPase [Betaproteobacteria bacterium]|nr:FliI/YscN family ATPase [Betaproteobacteria bacterium]